MQSLTTPVHSLPDVLFHYLFTGFGKLEAPALVSGGGMPADTLLFDAQSVIPSFTCVAPPMFRTKIERLAAAQSTDVMLVRYCLAVSRGHGHGRRHRHSNLNIRYDNRRPPSYSCALCKEGCITACQSANNAIRLRSGRRRPEVGRRLRALGVSTGTASG